MTTLTGNSGVTVDRAGKAWSRRHPLVTSLAVIAVAIVCGAMLGLLIDSVSQGPAHATVHRAGAAHGRVAQLLRAQDTVAAKAGATSVASNKARAENLRSAQGTTAAKHSTRSPARSGFAVGRGRVGTDRS